jgi:hypothetical protein
MRSQPSPMIKFCLARAAACRRDAEEATDPSSQQSWLEMEDRWFSLARSYERRPDNPPPMRRYAQKPVESTAFSLLSVAESRTRRP